MVKAIKGLPFITCRTRISVPAMQCSCRFWRVPAATVTGLARLGQLSARQRCLPADFASYREGRGYVLTFYPAWDNYPTDDIEADTRRMNEFIEQRVREMPEQYFWTHKRFKTRPPGEARFY